MAKKEILYTKHLNINMDGKVSEYGLDDYLIWIINGCEIFNKTGRGIRAGARIEAEIRKNVDARAAGKEVTKLTLDSDDAGMLAEVCEEPTNGYPLTPARILIPFIDAILNATEVVPPAAEEVPQA